MESHEGTGRLLLLSYCSRVFIFEGILDDMKRRGVRIIASYIIDNILCKVGDPLFVGFTAEQKYVFEFFSCFAHCLDLKWQLKFVLKPIRKRELELSR
jgi:hypothetical protein